MSGQLDPRIKEIFGDFCMAVDILGERERLAAAMPGEPRYSKRSDIAATHAAIQAVHDSKLACAKRGARKLRIKFDRAAFEQGFWARVASYAKTSPIVAAAIGNRLGASMPTISPSNRPKLQLVYSRD